MIISSTEAQNNFGKYLRACKTGAVMITKNGEIVAKLCDVESRVEESEAVYSVRNSMSYEHFEKMNRHSQKRYEFIDGEIHLLSSPRFDHQEMIMTLLRHFISIFDKGKCKPFVSPFDVTLYNKDNRDDVRAVVQPDILVACDTEKNINENGFYKGIPSLVIEVLSPSTRSRDHIKKLEVYKESGIGEYWIVDPETCEVLVFEFIDYEIGRVGAFHKGELIRSFLFENIEIKL
jgi:prevent-host-death family protein